MLVICDQASRCPFASDCPHGMKAHPWEPMCASELCDVFTHRRGDRVYKVRAECVEVEERVREVMVDGI